MRRVPAPSPSCSRGRARTLTWAAAALVGMAGLGACGELLGVDDYSTRPSWPNPCGALEVPLDDGSCAAVGVSTCADGFVADEHGGCASTLPGSPCQGGQLTHPGKVACAPVGDFVCEPGFDPDPKTFAGLGDAIVVWEGYAGTDSDGTPERPYRTIQAAVDAAPAGANIVVAPGTYAEDVVLDHRVVLRGICANGTTLSGSAVALTLGASGDGAAVRSLRITSTGVGVLVDGADDVELSGLWLDATGGAGIALAARPGAVPSAEIGSTLIDGSTGAGIRAAGYALDVLETDVRAVHSATGALEPAAGIDVRPLDAVAADEPGTVPRARVTIRRSLVEKTTGVGMRVRGGQAHVLDTVVRDTVRDEPVADRGWRDSGYGIEVEREALRRVGPTRESPVRIERSVVERSWSASVRVHGAHVVLVDTTLRGTVGVPGRDLGDGLRVLGDRAGTASATLDACAIEDVSTSGVRALGGSLHLTRTRIEGPVSVYQQPADRARDPALAVSLDRVSIRGRDSGSYSAFDAGGVDVSATGVLVDSSQVHDCPFEEGGPGTIDVGGVSCTLYGRLIDCIDQTCHLPQPEAEGPYSEDWGRETVDLGIAVRDAIGRDPLADATVTVLGQDETAPEVTSADGTASIRAPSAKQLYLSVERPGYVPTVTPLHTRRVSVLDTVDLVPLDLVASVLPDLAGRSLSADSGVLIVAAERGGLALTTSPEPLVPVVYFVDGVAKTNPDPKAGVIVALQLQPGPVELSFSDAATTDAVSCTGDLVAAYQGLDLETDRLLAPILEGRMTRMSPRCD